ncbi:hypothetical protein NN561_014797 [Cricetulus griseus]
MAILGPESNQIRRSTPKPPAAAQNSCPATEGEGRLELRFLPPTHLSTAQGCGLQEDGKGLWAPGRNLGSPHHVLCYGLASLCSFLHVPPWPPPAPAGSGRWSLAQLSAAHRPAERTELEAKRCRQRQAMRAGAACSAMDQSRLLLLLLLLGRSFSRPRPVRELHLGIPGWEGSAHFTGANPLPEWIPGKPFLAVWNNTVDPERQSRQPPTLSDAGMRSAGTLQAATVARGMHKPQATRRGHCGVSRCQDTKETCSTGLYTHSGECCKACNLGEGVAQPCGANQTVCEPCLDSVTFSDVVSATEPCKPCTECLGLQSMSAPCVEADDAVCRCAYGYYQDEETGRCEACSVCEVGSGLVFSCQDKQNTVCEECPEGTYSDEANHVDPCLPCTVCEDTERLLRECTPWADAECEGRWSRWHIPLMVSGDEAEALWQFNDMELAAVNGQAMTEVVLWNKRGVVNTGWEERSQRDKCESPNCRGSWVVHLTVGNSEAQGPLSHCLNAQISSRPHSARQSQTASQLDRLAVESGEEGFITLAQRSRHWSAAGLRLHLSVEAKIPRAGGSGPPGHESRAQPRTERCRGIAAPSAVQRRNLVLGISVNSVL